MSFVITALVVIGPSTPDAELDAAITAEGPRGYRLHKVNLDSGTTYTPIVTCYAGTFNHVADELLDWLSDLQWRYSDGGWPFPRDNVLVLTHHEYSEIAPLVYRLTKDGWERVSG